MPPAAATAERERDGGGQAAPNAGSAHDSEVAAALQSPRPDDGTSPSAGRRPLLLPASAAISVLAHASILIWLLIEPPSAPGLAGQELDAIGVEIVEASALESISTRPALDAAGGATSVVAETGMEAPVAQQEVTAATPTPTRTEVLPPEKAELQEEPEPVAEPEIAVARIADDVPDRPQVEEPRKDDSVKPAAERVPEIDEGHDKVLQAEQQAVAAGGMASRGAESSSASTAAATASPGQLARFAMQVRASLGRARPRHLGARGRVHVAFVLSEAGALLSAEVARSALDPRLDQAALQAVRATPFPRPPAGASQAQRSFVVPFDFK